MNKFLIVLLATCFFVACNNPIAPKEGTNPCGLSLEDITTYNCNFTTSIKPGDSVIDASQEAFYFEIWKSILLEKTGMTAAYFDTHFSNIKTYASAWNKGITFSVIHDYEVDWIKITRKDKFLIWMNSSVSAYQHHNIPRDQFLDKPMITFFLDEFIASSRMAYIKPIESLSVNSCEEAVEQLRAEGYDRLMPNRLVFEVPGKLPRIDGYPYLMVHGIENPDDNECAAGYINLFSGTTVVYQNACCIF